MELLAQLLESRPKRNNIAKGPQVTKAGRINSRVGLHLAGDTIKMEHQILCDLEAGARQSAEGMLVNAIGAGLNSLERLQSVAKRISMRSKELTCSARAASRGLVTVIITIRVVMQGEDVLVERDSTLQEAANCRRRITADGRRKHCCHFIACNGRKCCMELVLSMYYSPATSTGVYESWPSKSVVLASVMPTEMRGEGGTKAGESGLEGSLASPLLPWE